MLYKQGHLHIETRLEYDWVFGLWTLGHFLIVICLEYDLVFDVSDT